MRKEDRERSRQSAIAYIVSHNLEVHEQYHGDMHIVMYNNNLNKPCMRIWLRTQSEPFLRESYLNADQREKRLNCLKANHDSSQAYKKEWQDKRKLQAAELKASIKVGDILESTGGATMHFCCFYRVIARKGVKLELVPLPKKWVSGGPGDGHCLPDLDAIQVVKSVSGRIRNLGSVAVENDYTAQLWDGSEGYENHWD
jgi:hypothetical protein